MKAYTHYSVMIGRQTGIFKSWDECKASVNGFSNAKFKGYHNIEDAEKVLKDFAVEKLKSIDI